MKANTIRDLVLCVLCAAFLNFSLASFFVTILARNDQPSCLLKFCICDTSMLSMRRKDEFSFTTALLTFCQEFAALAIRSHIYIYIYIYTHT